MVKILSIEWLLFFALYLLFASSTKTDELVVAAIIASVATAGWELVRRQPFARFHAKLRWCAQGFRLPWLAVKDSGLVFSELVKRFFKHRKSVLREVRFDAGGNHSHSAARRALAIAYTTVTPNSIVLDIDIKKRRMIMHELVEAETSVLTRDLGAES